MKESIRIRNKPRLVGKSQVWVYNGGCEYECKFHRGKVEWHHPISNKPKIGLYLCEAHHSLLAGRSRRYREELLINKGLGDMRMEIKALEKQRVIKQGGNENEINKQ